MSYLSNGVPGLLAQRGNVCGQGAGRPVSCLPILFISAQSPFEGFGSSRCLWSMLLPPHTYKDSGSSPQILT